MSIYVCFELSHGLKIKLVNCSTLIILWSIFCCDIKKSKKLLEQVSSYKKKNMNIPHRKLDCRRKLGTFKV